MTASTMIDGEDDAAPRAARGAPRASVPVAVCLTVLLAVRAPTGGTRAAAIIYGVCVVAMLTVSGDLPHAPLVRARSPNPAPARPRDDPLRHRWHVHRGDRARDVGGDPSVLLVLVWMIAAAGIVLRMVWFDGPMVLGAWCISAPGGSWSSIPSPSCRRSTALNWRYSSPAGCSTRPGRSFSPVAAPTRGRRRSGSTRSGTPASSPRRSATG